MHSFPTKKIVVASSINSASLSLTDIGGKAVNASFFGEMMRRFFSGEGARFLQNFKFEDDSLSSTVPLVTVSKAVCFVYIAFIVLYQVLQRKCVKLDSIIGWKSVIGYRIHTQYSFDTFQIAFLIQNIHKNLYVFCKTEVGGYIGESTVKWSLSGVSSTFCGGGYMNSTNLIPAVCLYKLQGLGW